MSLLEIRHLAVDFQTAHGLFRAVDGVDLEVDQGDLVAIGGESGSVKSVSMLSLMGLLPWTATVTADCLAFDGRDRSEEHTSELQSLMRTSYDVFCLK